MKSIASNKGFTLVELLVVTGLMAGILGLVLAGFRPNEESQIRQAAETLASAIRHTQTRAMQSPQGAALIILTGTAVSTSTLWEGDVLPPIVGSGTFTPNGGGMFGALTSSTSNMVTADGLGGGYQISFSMGVSGPWGPSFGFVGSATGGTVELQRELGQTPATTVLPNNGFVWYQAVQRPLKASVVPFPKLAVIDTRWSSVGHDIDSNASFVTSAVSTGTLAIPSLVSPYANSLLSFAQAMGGVTEVALCFDRTGGLSSVVTLPAAGMPSKSNAPIKPTSPIYFLISGASAMASATTALDVVRSASPIWVAIDPTSGAVQIGKNTPPGPLTFVGLGKSAVVARIDAYFRSLRTTVFPSPFIEATK